MRVEVFVHRGDGEGLTNQNNLDQSGRPVRSTANSGRQVGLGSNTNFNASQSGTVQLFRILDWRMLR